ncbi:acyl-CoA dehydrogenase [Leptospira kanakyensis]|uniref:Acyl-CoA dehydrogenase n=1 Tax=Leptospira kanakyensis TaxID=2484968 RepID=A0A6N4QGT8_9LEPT|nr:acyl-CoA dehydrogenase [Leptospira kanakyensis]TGK53556.1 acyl-CoA dehydrogenase [Leptospira kanakyensis]TGK57351.1 acyl-CoA dehydrogenase [Leptospira kanakyensis]TGK73063.1 acyl-CoA dehydrogenase [Leptospira kanakyensis]
MNPTNENLILKYGEPGSIYPKNFTQSASVGFYRSWKPILIQEGYYHFLLGFESYLEFQKKISSLAEEPVGVSLSLSCMVEVNVAGGILYHASRIHKENHNQDQNRDTLTQEVLHSLWDGFREGNSTKIFAVGVSEPGWETKLRKLSSTVREGKLSGTKSFITNGAEADAIFWVTKSEEGNPIYLVQRNQKTNIQNIEGESKNPNQTIEESFHTDFTPLVTHLKLKLCEYPIHPEDMILENYGKLGMELRLKELLSLVSLLIGKSKKVSLENESVKVEREKLTLWRDNFLSQCQGNPDTDFLLSGFPYPTEGLLLALSQHWNLGSPKDLKSVDSDFQLFVWEDQFTEYLIQKKKRKLS